MSMSCVRFAKIKTKGHLAAAMGHNSRTRETPNADLTDPSRAVKNLIPMPENAGTRVDEIIGTQKVRKNAVQAVELVLTTSPEYFRPGHAEKAGTFAKVPTDAWAKASTDWLKTRYGDRLVSAQLHLDESTPHIHAVLVPLDRTGKLNCRGFLGGKPQLAEMQTSYAESLKHLGIERGLAGSKAIHRTIKQHYTLANTPVEPLPKAKTIKARQAQEVNRDKFSPLHVWSEKKLVAGAEAVMVAVADYQALESKAGKWQAQARESAELRTEAGRLKLANSRLSAENARLKEDAALVRNIPPREVLDKLYGVRGPLDVMEVDGKMVHLEGDHHRVGKSGKKSKSAIDLVRELQGYPADSEGTKLAVQKLQTVFGPDQVGPQLANELAHRAHENARKTYEQSLANGKAGKLPTQDIEKRER